MANKITFITENNQTKATFDYDNLPDIQANAIKKVLGITPSGKIDITNTSTYDVTDYAEAQIVDANLTAANIAKDVTILGITGEHEGGQQPTLFAPIVNQSNNTVTWSNSSANGSFAVTLTATVDGNTVTTPLTVTQALKNKQLVVTASATNFESSTSTLTLQYAPTPSYVEIEDTWDQIFTAIDNGTYTSKYAVGNYKPLDLGTFGTINMQIVDMNGDVKANGSGYAPISWLAMNLLGGDYVYHRMNPDLAGSEGNWTEGTGSIGGWGKSEMRSWLQSTIKPLIPTNVRNRMIEVTKYSSINTTAGTHTNNDETTDDIWIPSWRELNVNANLETSGPSYNAIYTNASSRIKQQPTGTASGYWMRSTGETLDYFMEVTSNGNTQASRARTSRGIAIGFCT